MTKGAMELHWDGISYFTSGSTEPQTFGHSGARVNDVARAAEGN